MMVRAAVMQASRNRVFDVKVDTDERTVIASTEDRLGAAADAAC
jgi:hypothetical protein